ncbi:LytR C-terminal domain-containing protein [Corynebacterium caspium]|uniref:LytR C-terminal domain-containing protein n=1 Tax=Corynebacterium caspium TaxID=234828 RepID=UPI0003719187|nr:LytR C-terminal domain-containing protein [Corynebacterium caspium]
MNTATHQPNNQSSRPGSGLPLRGLAMVLIAVALLLALWGIYALSQDSKKKDVPQAANTAASAPATPGVGSGATGPAGEASASAPAPAPAPAPGEAAGDAAAGASTTPNPAAVAPAEAPKPAELEVFILNNSTVGGWAATTAKEAKDAGFKVAYEGNLEGSIFTAQQSTVYFHAGNPTVEKQARELADRFAGGHAEPIGEHLPAEIKNAAGLTLVLAQ